MRAGGGRRFVVEMRRRARRRVEEARAPGGPGRRFLRVFGVNLLLTLVGACALALVGEAWLRRSHPFVASRYPLRFVPGVGVMLEPHGEVRHTNLFDFSTISRTNRLGFLDREPVSPERAASSCHIALIGDSFVEAREVEAPDKAQVQLEALAARARPDLDITTSAFGISATSQTSQIPLYDTYARHLRPKVLVLLATPNDYSGNSGVLTEVSSGALRTAWHAMAERGADGRIELRLPDGASPAVRARLDASKRWSRGVTGTFLWNLLWRNRIANDLREHQDRWERRDRWRRLSEGTASLSGWRLPGMDLGDTLVKYGLVSARRAGSGLAPAYAEALELTAFALDEFSARAARDGSRLVLFLNTYFGLAREYAMRTLAEERGIPVVDQYRYIIDSAGGDPRDAGFRRDEHWTPQGHRWVAEALWEYLKSRPYLCEPAGAGDSP